ncbi:MAG: hypothetical protein ACM3SM_12960 [Bacteroidota bacterium]
MEFETIVAVAAAKEIPVIKDVIRTLSEDIPGMVVTSMKMGKIGENNVVTFKVDSRSYSSIIEKLIINKIKILSLDEKTKNTVKTIQARTEQEKPLKATGWEELKGRNRGDGKKNMTESINNGDYAEVIKISRDYTVTREVAETAKQNIDTALEHAINRAFNTAVTRKYEAEKSISALVKIAADPVLKSLNKTEFAKLAGLKAVEACGMYSEMTGDLVKIANNSSLHNLVCVKAAVKFAEKVFTNEQLYGEEVEYAVRTLNIRWLEIALSMAQKELDSDELRRFNELSDFIRRKR